MDKIILPGHEQPDLPEPKPIYTRSGWQIPPPPSDFEWTHLRVDEMQGWAGFFEKRYGVKTRSLSRYPYNCVGMVFANRRALIDPQDVLSILKADGYHKIERSEVRPGDVVVYYYKNEPAHVALILRVEPIGKESYIEVMSKWGHYAEFIHALTPVHPNLGTPNEFYTDRL